MKMRYETYKAAIEAGLLEEPRPICPIIGNTYAFRLVFSSIKKGIFSFDEKTKQHTMPDSTAVTLEARSAEALKEADHYHFSAGGFHTRDSALEAGQRTRNSLHILDTVFSLGLHISTADIGPPEMWEVINHPDRYLTGVQANVEGLWVYPEDGVFSEFIISGGISTTPSFPEFALVSIERLWSIAREFAPETRPAVELLRSMALEDSMRAKFLLCYAALQTLVPPADRSKTSLDFLSEVQDYLDTSDVPHDDKAKLTSSLTNLRREAPSDSMRRFFSQFQGLALIDELEPIKFVLKCQVIRNFLSHPGSPNLPESIVGITENLRKLVFSLVLGINGLLPISLPGPGQRLTLDGFRIAVI